MWLSGGPIELARHLLSILLCLLLSGECYGGILDRSEQQQAGEAQAVGSSWNAVLEHARDQGDPVDVRLTSGRRLRGVVEDVRHAECSIRIDNDALLDIAYADIKDIRVRAHRTHTSRGQTMFGSGAKKLLIIVGVGALILIIAALELRKS